VWQLQVSLCTLWVLKPQAHCWDITDIELHLPFYRLFLFSVAKSFFNTVLMTNHFTLLFQVGGQTCSPFHVCSSTSVMQMLGQPHHWSMGDSGNWSLDLKANGGVGSPSAEWPCLEKPRNKPSWGCRLACKCSTNDELLLSSKRKLQSVSEIKSGQLKKKTLRDRRRQKTAV